jgi:integrase
MNVFIKKVKNKDGKIKETLWVNFIVDNKRVRKSLKLENTKANYKKVINEILPTLKYKLLNGELKVDQKKMPIVDEYIKLSFELHSGNRIKSTIYGHLKNYNKYIKHIFGNKKLDQITSTEITLWQNSLQSKNKLSKSYILKIRGLLNTMFEDAISDQIIKINPINNVKKLKETIDTKVKRQKLLPFKKEEIKKILNVSNGQNRNIIATLFFTGIRAGELIGLKWENIDFEQNTISIRQQIVNGLEKQYLKTSKGRRTIPIIYALKKYLQEQYKITGKYNSFVFLTKNSKKHYHSAGKIREQIWIPALANAQVKYRNLHQTRGTFIASNISNSEDINFLSRIIGHANVRITLEHYSEYIPSPTDNFGKYFNKL